MYSYKLKGNLPSGKIVYFEELKNDLYLAIHKILINDDKESFFKLLDEHFLKTIPNFNELDLLDKIYLYILLYVYSIKPVIELNPDSVNTLFDEEVNRINLASVIEQLEELNISRTNELKLKSKIGDITIKYGLPKKLENIEGKLTFEPLSSITNIIINEDDYKVENDQLGLLEKILSPDNYYTLIKDITEVYNKIIVIKKGQIEIPLLHIEMFNFIAYGLYNSSLDNVFTLMYSLNKHLHITIQDFFLLTPFDTRVIFEKLADDKEKENKANEDAMNNSKNNGQSLPF